MPPRRIEQLAKTVDCRQHNTNAATISNNDYTSASTAAATAAEFQQQLRANSKFPERALYAAANLSFHIDRLVPSKSFSDCDDDPRSTEAEAPAAVARAAAAAAGGAVVSHSTTTTKRRSKHSKESDISFSSSTHDISSSSPLDWSGNRGEWYDNNNDSEGGEDRINTMDSSSSSSSSSNSSLLYSQSQSKIGKEAAAAAAAVEPTLIDLLIQHSSCTSAVAASRVFVHIWDILSHLGVNEFTGKHNDSRENKENKKEEDISNTTSVPLRTKDSSSRSRSSSSSSLCHCCWHSVLPAPSALVCSTTYCRPAVTDPLFIKLVRGGRARSRSNSSSSSSNSATAGEGGTRSEAEDWSEYVEGEDYFTSEESLLDYLRLQLGLQTMPAQQKGQCFHGIASPRRIGQPEQRTERQQQQQYPSPSLRRSARTIAVAGLPPPHNNNRVIGTTININSARSALCSSTNGGSSYTVAADNNVTPVQRRSNGAAVAAIDGVVTTFGPPMLMPVAVAILSNTNTRQRMKSRSNRRSKGSGTTTTTTATGNRGGGPSVQDTTTTTIPVPAVGERGRGVKRKYLP